MGSRSMIAILLLVCLVLVWLAAIGCVRTIGRAPSDLMTTQDRAAADCGLDQSLLGTWTSSGRTQLGPASGRLVLECDCTYRIRYRLFGFLTVREFGPVRVDGDTIVLGRTQGRDRSTYFETGLRYRRDEGELRFVEDDPESPAWTRRGDAPSCR